jgi:hypothetical protein
MTDEELKALFDKKRSILADAIAIAEKQIAKKDAEPTTSKQVVHELPEGVTFDPSTMVDGMDA